MRIKLKPLLTAVLTAALLLGAVCVPAAASPRFSDVPSTHWAAGQITRGVQAGLFNGRSSTYFGAGRPMTRAEFAAALCRLFEWREVTPATGSFSDNLNPKAWYYSAVETAAANGALTRQSSAFRPKDPVTREEMTVMLVRSLGYTSIAGLAQDLPLPFRDVESSRGYIAMAYTLGITSGTSQTAFSPDGTATRAQAAVMLMRVYDALHAPPPTLWGIAPDSENLTVSGMDGVAAAAAKLTGGAAPRVDLLLSDARIRAIRAAAGGAKQLLYVSGSADVLAADPGAAAAALAAAVKAGGWSGLVLDIPKVDEGRKSALTALVTAARTALDKDALVYVVTEAPVWQGTAYGGYDFPALSAQADLLVVRVAPYYKTTSGVITAPPEPLEEVYYALAELKGTVKPEKLSLLLTTAGSGNLSGQRVAQLLSSPSTVAYYSSRYASAYLTRTAGTSTGVVWYQDAQAAAARARMCAFFGVGNICLSDLTALGDYGEDSLLNGLR